jgi:Domain of unknown function (DUF4271)
MRFLIILLVFCGLPLCAPALPAVLPYGIIQSSTDSLSAAKEVEPFADSCFTEIAFTPYRDIVDDFEIPHNPGWQTSDFYLVMIMVILLGIIRMTDVRYFAGLWKALANLSNGNSPVRDLIEGSGLQNLLMNLYFAFTAGVYAFYIIRYFHPGNSNLIPSYLLLTLSVCGIGLLYLVKYVAVVFSGWAFRVETLTSQYLFNVFLINKVLSIVLLPFILIIGFGAPAWAGPALLVSFVVLGILLSTRYIRSWQVFSSFLQFSKFHFFLYLCASEILPVSVLIKLIFKGFSL